MNPPYFDAVPPWARLLILLLHLPAGFALGVVYFHSLWWTIRRLDGDGRVGTVVAVMAGRLAVVGGLLALASLEGALPLLLAALGVLIARPLVMRRVQGKAA